MEPPERQRYLSEAVPAGLKKKKRSVALLWEHSRYHCFDYFFFITDFGKTTPKKVIVIYKKSCLRQFRTGSLPSILVDLWSSGYSHSIIASRLCDFSANLLSYQSSHQASIGERCPGYRHSRSYMMLFIWGWNVLSPWWEKPSAIASLFVFPPRRKTWRTCSQASPSRWRTAWGSTCWRDIRSRSCPRSRRCCAGGKETILQWGMR